MNVSFYAFFFLLNIGLTDWSRKVPDHQRILATNQANVPPDLTAEKINTSWCSFDVKASEPIPKVRATVSPTTLPVTTERLPATVARPNGAVSDCDAWHDKFTKKDVKAARVTLRGWKPGAVILNSVVGRGSANAFGIEEMEVYLIFRRDGDALTLVLYASKPGVHTMFVSSDKPLMFLMQDESVMEFMPAENSESDYTWGRSYSMESEMLMYYQLTEEQARMLTQKLIKEYRLNFYNRKFVQDKVNENRARQVRSAAQCVTN